MQQRKALKDDQMMSEHEGYRMNRQGLKVATATPRHLQQVLFLVLAVIVTLLIGQQVQRWNEARAVPASFLQSAQHHSTSVRANVSPIPAGTSPTYQRVDSQGTTDSLQNHSSWVF
jgi:hypothetical protein